MAKSKYSKEELCNEIVRIYEENKIMNTVILIENINKMILIAFGIVKESN